MLKGTVKFYIESRGFGFIKQDNGDPEIFFHATCLNSPVKQDERVSYEIQEGKKGRSATQVKKLS